MPITLFKNQETNSALEILLNDIQKYYHSHEYLGEKVMRRALLNDRGSRTDSNARQLARALLYLPAAIPCAWDIVPILGHAGRFIEKSMREAVGNGTARANQARDFYDACQNFLLDQSEENLGCILKIYEGRICDANWYRGPSKKLKPIAFNALQEIANRYRITINKYDDGIKLRLEKIIGVEVISHRYSTSF